VYGGEASQLSVRAVLPRFADMEAKYGSLGRAMLASRKKMAQAAKGPARPLFTSLKEGMQQLVDAVLVRLSPTSLRPNRDVQSIQPQDGGWMVANQHGADYYDAVVIATPTRAAAKIVKAASPQLASELDAIQYSSSVTVTLGYDHSVRSSLPPGFGFLVPKSEGRRMLAATFVHNKFPHRAPDDRALVRCFLGGARDEQILSSSEDEILQVVRGELREIIGLAAEPRFARVYKWRGAMAQYGVGHLDRLDRIAKLTQQLPGLALAGNGYRGIGVPDCVRSGTDAASSLAAQLTAAGLNSAPA
jgi:oxygen-dependent protoporphyrinogen oxidase